MIVNTSGTPIGSDEGGLIKALDRERARYYERQAALLARVLRGRKPKWPGAEDRAGTDDPVGGMTAGVA